MRRIRHVHGGDPGALLLEDVPEPTPGPVESLVRTEAVGVTLPAVGKLWRSAEPVAFGGEIVCTVTGLGQGVTGFASDDRVTGQRFEHSCAEVVVSMPRWCAPGWSRGSREGELVTAAAGGVGHLAV